jgi:hypoxanthine phosphoribosyltransferase
MLEADVAQVLISEETLQARVRELGQALAQDYRDKNPLIVSVLKGATVFVADLIRTMDIPLAIDFIATSSYANGDTSSGVVRILMDLASSIQGRHVVVVEDIIDSGRTLNYLLSTLETREPASLRLCVLLDKPQRREVPVHVDYVGFDIPDYFVVGYGLDYAEKYRNLPFIGVLKPELYQKACG